MNLWETFYANKLKKDCRIRYTAALQSFFMNGKSQCIYFSHYWFIFQRFNKCIPGITFTVQMQSPQRNMYISFLLTLFGTLFFEGSFFMRLLFSHWKNNLKQCPSRLLIIGCDASSMVFHNGLSNIKA